MEIEVYLVNSFTANGQGGNPAGVVLNADSLSDKQKLYIAQQVGYSETAFVSKDPDADFQVSFFTVSEEVDFCGHATLAVFHTLYKNNLIEEGQFTQKTRAGLLSVDVHSNGLIVMEQMLPDFREELSYEEVAELIGIDTKQLASTGLPIQIVSTGLPDILVAVPNGLLDKITINETLLCEYSKRHKVIGLHAFELPAQDSDINASCRNFAPLYGIAEESATGSSNGALACYLVKHLIASPFTDIKFEQGRVMGCTSSIISTIRTEGERITKVQVGGQASQSGIQTVTL